MPENRITVEQLRTWDGARPLLAMTAYDYTIARLLDEAGVEILHVGDSLGMIVLGHEDTTEVTMADMLRATESVARARQHALITADLPFAAYDNPDQALENARQLMEAGADAVKMEGGAEILAQTRAVAAAGIPFQGHLGMLPQQIREEGAYKKKGKSRDEAERILSDARLLEAEGAFSLVLESVVPDVAEEVTAALKIPTIGIASGTGTTGQIRVYSDVIGLTPWFQFPHVQPQVNTAEQVRSALSLLRTTL